MSHPRPSPGSVPQLTAACWPTQNGDVLWNQGKCFASRWYATCVIAFPKDEKGLQVTRHTTIPMNWSDRCYRPQDPLVRARRYRTGAALSRHSFDSCTSRRDVKTLANTTINTVHEALPASGAPLSAETQLTEAVFGQCRFHCSLSLAKVYEWEGAVLRVAKLPHYNHRHHVMRLTPCRWSWSYIAMLLCHEQGLRGLGQESVVKKTKAEIAVLLRSQCDVPGSSGTMYQRLR